MVCSHAVNASAPSSFGFHPMPLPRFRIRTLMIAVAVAAVISAAFSSSESFQLVVGSVPPASFFTVSLVYTVFLAFSKATLADDEKGEL